MLIEKGPTPRWYPLYGSDSFVNKVVDLARQYPLYGFDGFVNRVADFARQSTHVSSKECSGGRQETKHKWGLLLLVRCVLGSGEVRLWGSQALATGAV